MSAPLPPPPDWMTSFPEEPPSVEDAMEALIAAYRDHAAPTHMCRQCFNEETEARIIAAAKLAQAGQTPRAEEFAQIYFEHPNCVGGEETLKLFLPHGLRLMLTGTPPPGFSKHSYPEVLETSLKAGFWFWRPELIGPVRNLAARLFVDWFSEGRFDLEGWPHSDVPRDDLVGAGDDIMHLCSACLIDPAELVARLHDLQTPWADEELSYPASHFFHPPFYMSVETGQKDGPYMTATRQIASSMDTRIAQATLLYSTQAWLRDAFYRREKEYPELAKALSDFENYYDVTMVDVVKAAQQPMLTEWPDLPYI